MLTLQYVNPLHKLILFTSDATELLQKAEALKRAAHFFLRHIQSIISSLIELNHSELYKNQQDFKMYALFNTETIQSRQNRASKVIISGSNEN